jgi:ABC-2 type transport system ATP-binding protein
VSAPLLSVQALTKSFASGPPWRRVSVSALDGVELSVGAGEVLVILGANGSGKTTLLKILASLVTPDAGRLELGGRPLGDDSKRLVGFASGEERSLFFRLSGRQNLAFFAALFGLDRAAARGRIDELASAFDLDGFLDRRIDRCSSGMRARLGLARALLHAPRLLLLDEPTKSLDPAHAVTARSVAKDWARAGNGVIMVTHLVAEADEIATRIGILDRGRLTIHSPQSDWKSHLTEAAA